jgi:hypothetical protein
MHVYEIRPRKDKRGADLISDVLPFGRLLYGEPNAISNAVSYAQFFSRSHHAVIRVYDLTGNMIETREHKGDSRRFEAGPQFLSSAHDETRSVPMRSTIPLCPLVEPGTPVVRS